MSAPVAVDLPLEAICAYGKTQPIARLSLFGSALRDELRPDSDIDLLVAFSPGARIGYFELAQHEIDLSELIGRQVDLRTPNELSKCIRG